MNLQAITDNQKMSSEQKSEISEPRFAVQLIKFNMPSKHDFPKQDENTF